MAPIQPSSMANWMTSLPDKNIRLTQLTIPGTHDSFCSENKLRLGLVSFNKSFAACQHDDFTVEQQLHAGIRFLDFRVEFDGKLSHGVARLEGYLYDQIRVVVKFLEANPGETVLISLKWELEEVNWKFEVEGTPEPEGEASRIIQRLREVEGAKWWMESTVPTLAQAAGHMVFFTRLSETARAGIRYEPGGEKLKDIPAPYASQDNYNMGCVEEAGHRKWSQHVHPFLERALATPADGVLYFNFLSAYAGDGKPWNNNATPADVANVNNSILVGFTHEVLGRPGIHRMGVLLMDFPPPELIRLLVDTNFSATR